MKWFRIYTVRRIKVVRDLKTVTEPRIEHYGDFLADSEEAARAEARLHVKTDFDIVYMRHDEISKIKPVPWRKKT